MWALRSCVYLSQTFVRIRWEALLCWTTVILMNQLFKLFPPSLTVQLLKSTDLSRHSLLYLKEIGNGWFGKVRPPERFQSEMLSCLSCQWLTGHLNCYIKTVRASSVAVTELLISLITYKTWNDRNKGASCDLWIHKVETEEFNP